MAINGNGIGKWQLAFWIVTVLCLGGLTGLSARVYAIDKDSVKRDIRLVDRIQIIKDEQNKKLDLIKSEQQIQSTKILIAIERLKVKLERNNN